MYGYVSTKTNPHVYVFGVVGMDDANVKISRSRTIKSIAQKEFVLACMQNDVMAVIRTYGIQAEPCLVRCAFLPAFAPSTNERFTVRGTLCDASARSATASSRAGHATTPHGASVFSCVFRVEGATPCP